MKTITCNTKLFVSTYSKYNNGSLAGQWVELSQFSDAEEFLEYCKKLHSDEEQPEFMFQGCEDIPDAYTNLRTDG